MSEPKFKCGDLLRCFNLSHPDENPFVVTYVYDSVTANGFLYYGGKRTPDVSRDKGNKHKDGGKCGCRESELELVEGTE